MAIPVFRPTIRRRDMDAVLTCMVSDRIGPGALAQELASAVGSLLGTAGGLALSSYSEAIRCALEFYGVGAGTAVVLSPLAPAPYGEVLHRLGVEPLLADVDPATGVVSAAAVRRLLERKPRAVIVHHTLGHLPEAEGFLELGVPLIEDASQSLAGYAPDRAPTLVGDLVLLSLDPSNLITAGAGGLLLARARKDWKALREFGEDGAGATRLADMNAALGLSQLRELGRFLSHRREIGTLFLQSISRTAHRPLVPKGEGDYCYYSFPVLVEHGLKEVRQYAQKKEIETRPAYADSLLARIGRPEPEAAGAGPAAATQAPPGAGVAAGPQAAGVQPPASQGPDSGAVAAGMAQMPAPQTPEARNLLLRCLLFPLYPSLGRRNIDTISKVLMSLP